jgi:hypothetical protein
MCKTCHASSVALAASKGCDAFQDAVRRLTPSAKTSTKSGNDLSSPSGSDLVKPSSGGSNAMDSLTGDSRLRSPSSNRRVTIPTAIAGCFKSSQHTDTGA